MMNSSSNLALVLPKFNRDTHSLFALNGNAVNSWLNSLPLANLGESTRQLFQALAELSHVACKAKDRLEILEKIRPQVHYVTKGLSQHYLNKPIILPEKTQKIVLLADTLNTQLATAYCQTFQGFEAESRLIKPKEAMATCLHRALTEHSCILLRSHQLYRASQNGFWLTLHTIYQCALSMKLSKIKVSDESHGDSVVMQAYLRPLMLACSRTHQLPQRHIEEIFKELNYWTAFIDLRADRLESCVLLLNPKDDSQPVYRELIKRAPAQGWLGIDTKIILKHGGALTDSPPARKSSPPSTLPKTIIDHLSLAWSSATSRAAERVPCNEPVLITLGMNATHYFVANQVDFDQFKIDRDQAESRPDPYLNDGKKTKDTWGSNGLDTRDFDTNATEHLDIEYDEAPTHVENISYSLPSNNHSSPSPDTKHQYLRTRILDTSSAGYRLEWPESAQVRIRTGELLGIKVSDHEGWRIAVVRWLRSDDIHQIGIETIASAATPYSVRLIHSGLPVQDFQRAMLLPGGQLAKGPLLLLSTVTGFAEGQTVELIRPGHTMRVKLDKKIETSNAFKLFTFQDISRAANKLDSSAAEQENKGDFNQLWDIL
ncbi:hypothetical protein [Zhongshania sp.]|uniref:hypothetical protein n=3 Tax=Zhongshania sp. TaxID=1971902 RepID=UPI0035685BC3